MAAPKADRVLFCDVLSYLKGGKPVPRCEPLSRSQKGWKALREKYGDDVDVAQNLVGSALATKHSWKGSGVYERVATGDPHGDIYLHDVKAIEKAADVVGSSGWTDQTRVWWKQDLPPGTGIEIPHPPQADIEGRGIGTFSTEDANRMASILNLLVDKPVALSGGGGSSLRLAILKGVEVVPHFDKGEWAPGQGHFLRQDMSTPPTSASVRVRLHSAPGSPIHDSLEFDPNLGSWAISAIEGFGADEAKAAIVAEPRVGWDPFPYGQEDVAKVAAAVASAGGIQETDEMDSPTAISARGSTRQAVDSVVSNLDATAASIGVRPDAVLQVLRDHHSYYG